VAGGSASRQTYDVFDVSLRLENGPALAIVMTIINTRLANTPLPAGRTGPRGPGDRGSLRSELTPGPLVTF
jgi:hypothetical protein